MPSLCFSWSRAPNIITDASWARRRNTWKRDKEGFPANNTRQASPPSVHNSIKQERGKEGEDKGTPKYLIERDIPGIANATADEIGPYRRNRAAFSISIGPAIQWLHGYVTADKIYRVYIAPAKKWFANVRPREAS